MAGVTIDPTIIERFEALGAEARRWVHRSYVVFGLAAVFPVVYVIFGGFPPLDRYRWWLIGAYIVLFAVGCGLIHKSRLVTVRLMQEAHAYRQGRTD